MLEDNKNKNYNKVIVFIIGVILILTVLSVLAIFSGAVMSFLGFEYQSAVYFVLYFIIASIVSCPMNLVAGALPKALLNIHKITRKFAIFLYVLLDMFTTFCGFYIVDYFMPFVSGNTISLLVLALVFSLFGISDVKKQKS